MKTNEVHKSAKPSRRGMGLGRAAVQLAFALALLPGATASAAWDWSWLFGAKAVEKPALEMSAAKISGSIVEENVTFMLTFTATANKAEQELVLVRGAVSLLEQSLPPDSVLRRENNAYIVKFPKRKTGPMPVSITFAASAVKKEDWREASFSIPRATVRELGMVCDRDNLEVVFPGALDIKRGKDAAGKTLVTGLLAVDRDFTVSWKPEVRKLDGELVASCDANTIASARVGALQTDTVLIYRIAQGQLKTLELELPAALQVTQVRGMDIREWEIVPGVGTALRTLRVTLNRPKDRLYFLQVEGDVVLPAFPAKWEMPFLAPKNVIRTSGFLLIGANSTVKLLVNKASGLTQIDQAAFPAATLDIKDAPVRALPGRGAYAYQYANLPCQMELSADDIVTGLFAEDSLVLELENNNLTLTAKAELEIRDAPAKEIIVQVDPKWVVANVTGNDLVDYDVRDRDGKRFVHAYFRKEASGRALIVVRMEKTLEDAAGTFAMPVFRIEGAKAERGWLVLKAEQGIQLKAADIKGLREVHAGSSLPVKVPGAQSAFRFKDTEWGGKIAVEKAAPSVHAEAFHLVSPGEGTLYGSCSITYSISGAPVRSFRVRVPAACQNVEFTGRDVRGWQHGSTDPELYTVSLQEKALGDYTLLLTYSQPVKYEGGEIAAGGIQVLDTESETGYIALAGAASLSFVGDTVDKTVLPLSAEELPREYFLLINDPVIRAYKFVGAPHEAKVKIKRFTTEPPQGQISDHMTLVTKIGETGEAVTEANYFVKNTTGQYFRVTLPKDAALWSAMVNGKSVRVLDEGTGALLLPVERRRDPNEALDVKLTYAQQGGKIDWKRDFAFHSPGIGARSVFASWKFTAPATFSIQSSGGNMLDRQALEGTAPLVACGTALGDVFKELARNNQLPLCLVLFVLLPLVIVVSLNAGRGVPLAWSSWIGLLVALIVAVFILGMGRNGTMNPVAYAESALQHADWPVCDITMTKPVTLADKELHVNLAVVADKHTLAMNLSMLGGSLLGAVALLVFLRRWRPLALSLSGVLVLWGACHFPAVPAYAAVLLLILAVLAVAVALGRVMYRVGSRHPVAPGSAGALTGEAAAEPTDARTNTDGHGPTRTGTDSAAPGTPEHQLGSVLSEDARLKLGTTNGTPTDRSDKSDASDQSDKPVPPTSGGTAALLALAFLLAGSATAQAKDIFIPNPGSAAVAQSATSDAMPVMGSVGISVQLPDVTKPSDTPQNATVTLELAFEIKDEKDHPFTPFRFRAVPPEFVLAKCEVDAKALRLESDPTGYYLQVLKAGKHTVKLIVLTPLLASKDGTGSLTLPVPAHMRNRVTVSLPAAGWEIKAPRAIALTVVEKGSVTTAEIIAGNEPTLAISWQPRTRKTSTEKAEFFCEINSLAAFQPGVVTLSHQMLFQIAQGELQALAAKIPEGMNVTAVTGSGISTWRFDPVSRTLDVLLEKPVSGEFQLGVMTQIPRESLPYTAELGVPAVQGASRQRGTLALACGAAVQLRAEDPGTLSGMAAADFSPALFREVLANAGGAEVRRAFRYNQLPAKVKAAAEKVLPEIRVEESSQVDVSDERVMLSTALQVTVAKAGIFSLRLDIPDGYDVETLTGNEISHWDEVREGGRGVLVHFLRQAQGTLTLNLVLARLEKGLPQTLDLPKVGVRDAFKQAGTTVLSGERGVRFTAVKRDGVSELNPRELGIEQPGCLAFRLLRPDWLVSLKTEALEPVVKADVLQQFRLSEGLVTASATILYTVEHAGVKLFRLQSPDPTAALSIAGRNVARVQKVDADKGVWEIELTSKMEKEYRLEATWQLPSGNGGKILRVTPLKTLGTEAQKGWLVLFAGDRLQVQSTGTPTGMAPEDPRGVQAGRFGAGDLSGAILCYRMTNPDSKLELNVERRDTAEMLRAEVKSLTLTSIVSDDHQMLTRAIMELDVKTLRFLEITLPAGRQMWSAFVNGKPVMPLTEKGGYLIPLESGTASASVEFLFGGVADSATTFGKLRCDGPQFNLPLKNVTWEFYLPPGFNYHGIEGTLREQESAGGDIQYFDTETYRRSNQVQLVESKNKAEQNLILGNDLWKKGDQRQARQALQSAITFSNGSVALNEDARIQFRNLVRQQAVAGFANRRAELRRNTDVTQGAVSQADSLNFNDGNLNADYSRQLEQQLGAKENSSLGKVAEKIMDQQAAAEAEINPIRVTLPLQGRHLVFKRDLQTKANDEMFLSFQASSDRTRQFLAPAGIAAALFAALWLLAALAAPGTRRE